MDRKMHPCQADQTRMELALATSFYVTIVSKWPYLHPRQQRKVRERGEGSTQEDRIESTTFSRMHP
jgi:hypothetical protein